MNTLDGAVCSVARALGIDAEEVERLRLLVELREGDEEVLKETAALLRGWIPRVVQAFYDTLLGLEETAPHLQDPATVERLKTKFETYLHRLLTGPYGLEYAMHRVRVGVVHQRIGIQPRVYLAAWCRLLQILAEEVLAAHAADPARGRAALSALFKVAFLDMDLSLHTYLHADHEASEERFRDLVEGLDAIVWEAEADDGHCCRFTFVSRRAEEVLGYPAAEWVEEPDFWVKHIHPEDRERTLAACRAAIEEGKDHEFEYRAVARDGRTVWLHKLVHMIPREPGKKARMRGLTVDVTERRRLEEQVRQWQKMDALGRMAAVVAHEFNNQLGLVLGFADDLLRSVDAADPLRSKAEDVVLAARRAGAVTRPLLSFARPETGEPPIIDLGGAIAEMEGILRGAAGPDVRLVLSVAQEICPVRASTSQVAQILLNMVLNARDAMPGGGSLTVGATTVDLGPQDTQWGVVRPGRYAMISVVDTGCGMDESVRARLFEPFFTTKAPGKGTGLGLSTVYGIVRQLGGTISVLSEPGRGTTFQVYLPCAGAR